MMPLSLLSRVDVGEVTEAWLDEVCLLLPSPPAGGCSVEQGEVLLLARLDEGEILCGKEEKQYPHCHFCYIFMVPLSVIFYHCVLYVMFFAKLAFMHLY